jgi:hypothetical protein
MTNSDHSEGPLRDCFHHRKVGNLSPLFFTGKEFVQNVDCIREDLTPMIQATEQTTGKF